MEKIRTIEQRKREYWSRNGKRLKKTGMTFGTVFMPDAYEEEVLKEVVDKVNMIIEKLSDIGVK